MAIVTRAGEWVEADPFDDAEPAAVYGIVEALGAEGVALAGLEPQAARLARRGRATGEV